MNPIELTASLRERLFDIPLFRDLPSKIRNYMLELLDYTVYDLEPSEIIARQGAQCSRLMVLLSGKLRVDIIDGLGNEVLIEYIDAPRTFATPHLFSADNTLPATFTVLEPSVLLTATKDSAFKMLNQDPQILRNFFCIMGNCNSCTVTRLKPLSRRTVRERIIVYLLEICKPAQSAVTLHHNQTQLAEYLNVSRPALSKELSKMVNEGLIAMNGKQVTLLDRQSLQASI